MKSRRYACLFAWVLLSGLLFSASAGAADDSHPLRPVDTSSPRESLRNFITKLDAGYIEMSDVMASHMGSGRLYLSKDERRKQREVYSIAKDALRSLDFSSVLPILQPVLDVLEPDGAFYLWPDIQRDDEAFTRDLYATQNLTILPGSYLARDSRAGNPGRHRVRISLVAPVDECVQAAQRIRTFLESP